MAQTTITESLAEIKTIGKRLIKKRHALGSYIARDVRVRDPLEKNGGSEKFVAEERQSIADLENRVIAIRTAIQQSNLNSTVTVGGSTRSVAARGTRVFRSVYSKFAFRTPSANCHVSVPAGN